MPFLVLGGLVAIRGARAFVSTSLFIVLLGGAALWLFGRFSYHIGASTLIFGYFGYLVARGWYERSIWSILTAFLTLFLYGSIIWGVVPTRSFISWEGHLFGLLSGILSASAGREVPGIAIPLTVQNLVFACGISLVTMTESIAMNSPTTMRTLWAPKCGFENIIEGFHASLRRSRMRSVPE